MGIVFVFTYMHIHVLLLLWLRIAEKYIYKWIDIFLWLCPLLSGLFVQTRFIWKTRAKEVLTKGVMSQLLPTSKLFPTLMMINTIEINIKGIGFLLEKRDCGISRVSWFVDSNTWTTNFLCCRLRRCFFTTDLTVLKTHFGFTRLFADHTYGHEQTKHHRFLPQQPGLAQGWARCSVGPGSSAALGPSIGTQRPAASAERS